MTSDHMHERRSLMDRRDHDSETDLESLAPRHHFRRRTAIHVGLVEYDVGSHVRWPGGQHLLLAVNQIGGVKGRQFESMTVRDGVGGTGLHAISAENAAVVIDVVNLGVALGAADAVFGGIL